MSDQSKIKLKITKSNYKILLVCPFDHRIDRVTDATVLPILHCHQDEIYKCLAFKTIKDVRIWLSKNRPLK